MPVCGADKTGQRQPVRACRLRLHQTHTTVFEFERNSYQIAVGTHLDLRPEVYMPAPPQCAFGGARARRWERKKRAANCRGRNTL